MADLHIPIPFKDPAPVFAYFGDAPRATAALGIVVEITDVSWSPDALTPPGLDPTQEPWPLFLEAPQPPAARQSSTDETSDQAWLSAEAGPGDVVFDYFVPPIPGAVPRATGLDETSDQAWLSSEAGPGDAVFDYWQEPPRGAVPRGQTLEENVAPAWLSSEAGGADPVFGYFVDAPPQTPPLDIPVEGADVSWSPDAQPFDATKIPWPLFVEPPFVPPTVAPPYEMWAGWLGQEAGPGDAVFDYFSGWPVTSPPSRIPVDGADVSWSPDAQPPAFDATQIPWPMFVEAPQPGLRWPPVEGTFDVSWSPDIAPVVAPFFDWFVPAPQPLPQRTEVTPPWDGWIAATLPAPIPTYFDLYADAPQPWRFPVPAELVDVSWSPDRGTNVVPVLALRGAAQIGDTSLDRGQTSDSRLDRARTSDSPVDRGQTSDRKLGRGGGGIKP
jgi:hypothetical protein